MTRTATATRSSAKYKPTVAAPKRRGRPVGSKNGVGKTSKAKAPAATRSATVRKAAPAAPKLSKAELEAHIIKLERTINRLRKQGAEMKQTAKALAAEPATALAKATPKKTPRTKANATASAPAAKPRRATKKSAETSTSTDDGTFESASAEI